MTTFKWYDIAVATSFRESEVSEYDASDWPMPMDRPEDVT